MISHRQRLRKMHGVPNQNLPLVIGCRQLKVRDAKQEKVKRGKINDKEKRIYT